MRAARLSLGAVGLAALAWGVWGTVNDPRANPVGAAAFALIVLFGHDLLVLPVAIGLGALLTRRAPARVRGPLQAGLFVSAVLTVVALPFIIGTGTSPDNPSALPLNYGRGLLIALAAVWAGVAGVLGWRCADARREVPHGDDED